jgi:hypothetical protein
MTIVGRPQIRRNQHRKETTMSKNDFEAPSLNDAWAGMPHSDAFTTTLKAMRVFEDALRASAQQQEAENRTLRDSIQQQKDVNWALRVQIDLWRNTAAADSLPDPTIEEGA